MHYLHHRRATDDDLTILENWLEDRALEHDRPTFLLHIAAERLRWEFVLRPGLTILERLVSTARQRARKNTFENLSHLFTSQGKRFLNYLLEVDEGDYRTPLAWLQKMPNDHTSTQIIATLDKIQFLQRVGVPAWELGAVNPNRLKFLANIGAWATNQQLQRSATIRRYLATAPGAAVRRHLCGTCPPLR